MASQDDSNGLPDRRLVEMARSARPGDLAPFNELVARHEGHVRANCRYLTGDPQDAEDLAQEVFVKAFFALRSFEARSTFRTWIRRIKVNQCLNHMASRAGRTFVNVGDPSLGGRAEMRVAPEAELWLERVDLRRKVGAILDMLNDTLRVPLVMRDMDGMTYEEIAEALGIGLSAVKMRINRARRAFREQWATYVAREERV